MCSYEVDQPGLFERACGPTMPTSVATATHFTSSIIPSTFPCGRGAGKEGGGYFHDAKHCQQHRIPELLASRYTKGSPAHRPPLKDPEVHSSKFATRQVASSRMALPASSSGDEVEGKPFRQTEGVG